MKGATDKTINWVNSTNAWTSNQIFSAPNLTLTSLSAQNSEATALVVNGSNVVGTRELGSNAFNSTTIPTNNNQLTNGAAYITSFDITTQTDSKYLRSNAADSTNSTLTSTNGLGFRVDSNASSRIEIESGGTNWAYLRLKDDGNVSWDIASYNGGQLEFRPAGSGTNNMVYTSAGVLSIGGGSRVFADNYHPNADQLTTARTISLAGNVTGSVSFNGSGNVSITTALAANSVGSSEIATDAVGASEIAANSVRASELSVSGNGTTAQFLRSDGDGTFSWVTPTDTNTDTNTTYSAGTGITLSGTTFNLTDTAAKLNLSGGTMTGILTHDNNAAMRVAHYAGSGTPTGAILLTLPGAHTSNWSMLVLRITVYEYSSDTHTIFYVSGHDWTSGWYNKSITKMGDCSKTMAFGYSSTTNKDYIILGATNSTWAYPHVTVDVMSHPDFYVSSMDISTGWDLSKVTTLPSGFTSQAATNNKVFDDGYHPNADQLTTARTISLAGNVTGSVSFNGSSNVSITTALAANSVGASEIAANAVGSSEIATDAVGASEIAANAVRASELSVSGNGSTSQFLRSDGDGTFTWATPTDTNTVYTHPTSAGNKHVPTGGSSGQFLKYSSSGTATWATPSYTTNTDTNTTYSAGSGLNLSGTTFRLKGGEIPSGVNLNTYRTTGVYSQNSNADATAGSNWPANAAGILEVWNDDYGNGIHCTQRYSQYNTTNVYNRNYYNGTWTAWRDLTQDTNTVYTLPSNVVIDSSNYSVSNRIRFRANETNNWDTIATTSRLSRLYRNI